MGPIAFKGREPAASASLKKRAAPESRPLSGLQSSYASCARTGFRRRRIVNPIAPKPMSIMAQVAGSGTA